VGAVMFFGMGALFQNATVCLSHFQLFIFIGYIPGLKKGTTIIMHVGLIAFRKNQLEN